MRRVLVVDGGTSLRCALVGGMLAELGARNGWAGIVVYGCVRDCNELAAQPIDVKAPLLASGKLKSRIDIIEGLARFPEALRRLLAGRNDGKQVLKL